MVGMKADLTADWKGEKRAAYLAGNWAVQMDLMWVAG